MNIIIKNNLLLYSGYKIKCSIGKKGTTYSKKEGDLTTPKGLFNLGLLYYRKDRIKIKKCIIKKKLLKKIWVGVMILEARIIISKYISLLNIKQKNFIEEIKFTIFLLT